MFARLLIAVAFLFATNAFASDHKGPETHYFIVGISTLANFPDMDPVTGAVTNCRRLKEFFVEEIGVSDRNVTSVCGADATSSSVFSMLDYPLANMNDGDTLVVIWIGPGVTRDAEIKIDDIATSEPRPYLLSHEVKGPITENSGLAITPTLLIDYARSVRNTVKPRIVFLLDAVHSGELDGTPMRGPVASSLDGEPSVFALSATSGTDVSEPNAFAQDLMDCWRTHTRPQHEDDAFVTADLVTCMGPANKSHSYARSLSIPSVTDITLWRNPNAGTLAAKNRPNNGQSFLGMKKDTRLKLGIISTAVGAAALVTSMATFRAADNRRPALKSSSGFTSEKAFDAERDRYATERTATYALRGVGIPLVLGGTVMIAF